VAGIRAMLDADYAKRTGVKPKTTTIRKERKRPFRKGDNLVLFTGLRTKQCEKLGEVRCTKVELIEMKLVWGVYTVKIDGELLDEKSLTAIARKDGFQNSNLMMRFFKRVHGFPFEGQRIHMKNTYDRKYFCNKKVKDHGFGLTLETTQKTINVRQEDVEKAQGDRYIQELAEKHSYGVQIINPMYYE